MRMELGEAVDYVIEYNEINTPKEEKSGKNKNTKEEPTKRKATQADWDAFWG